jgi:hypothetical protein
MYGYKKHGSCVCVDLCFSCGNKKKAASYPQIPGYEMANPVVIHLKGDLDEISGILITPKTQAFLLSMMNAAFCTRFI